MNKFPIIIKQNTRTFVSSEKSNDLGILNSGFGLDSLEAMGYLGASFLLLWCCRCSQYSSFSVGLWDAAHNHFSQPSLIILSSELSKHLFISPLKVFVLHFYSSVTQEKQTSKSIATLTF